MASDVSEVKRILTRCGITEVKEVGSECKWTVNGSCTSRLPVLHAKTELGQYDTSVYFDAFTKDWVIVVAPSTSETLVNGAFLA